MSSIGQVINAMIDYFDGDMRRINHLLKVYGFAKAIGELEKLDEKRQKVLEIAALTHDIGIKNSEKKYDSNAGEYQQIEGPPEAKKILEDLGFEVSLIERVCWLIAHHHTYTDIQGIDYQILIEADFLVNAFEDHMQPDSIVSTRNKVFKTGSGVKLLNICYSL